MVIGSTMLHPSLRGLVDQIHGAWRFRGWALLLAVAVAFAGWGFVFGMPDRYEAEAQILVDNRTALKPVLQGLTMDQDVNVQLDYVRQSLLVDAQLCKVVMQAGMVPYCAVDPGAAQIPLAQIRNRIQLDVQSIDDRSSASGSAGTTFAITYQDEQRAHALKVISVLLDTLVTETLGGKREGSEHAQEFLESQVKDYEKRLQTSEDNLAAFKSKNLGLLPTDEGGYFAQLQKETQAVEDAKTKLLTAQKRRMTLESQLRGNAAVLASTAVSTSNGAGGTRAVDTVSEIAATQAHLDELLLTYTEKHPDVIAARAALAELKKRRAAEIESLRNGDAAAAAATGASSNPVFQSIQLALNQADVDIADVRSQLEQHESKAAELRALVDSAPQVEAQYAQLTRDYDVNKTQYTALLSNYEKSKLGQRADDAGSVRFQVVQPPTVSFRPVSPKRNELLAGVLLAALAAGVALAYGLNQLSPVVGSAESITQLTGVTVLAEVGTAFPTRSKATSRRAYWQVSIAIGFLVCLLGVEMMLSREGLRLSIPAFRQLVRTWI
jgi:polysaccharide chain length determinant protein (PEP-CTERM system associated)